jgi:hypothetical protein
MASGTAIWRASGNAVTTGTADFIVDDLIVGRHCRWNEMLALGPFLRHGGIAIGGGSGSSGARVGGDTTSDAREEDARARMSWTARARRRGIPNQKLGSRCGQ